MAWRMKDWKDDCNAVVQITYSDTGDNCCDVEVKIDEIPEYDKYDKFVHLDNLEGGWRQMIFKRIEQVFGYPEKK